MKIHQEYTFLNNKNKHKLYTIQFMLIHNLINAIFNVYIYVIYTTF
ncbi:hypothetical protein CNEO4_570020 [Clostridium neonatale]|nr:hypothetical protein CNEO_1350012 [Clostridium neonatale]CAI3206389.1 hypothetical protein CNEO2_510027 [Clostridium neonatale]CAI3210980.1 hypothetical protein CNEO2_460020 [Clostridium neonatale]CAI3632038.1 hypothetical protein CNEO3_720013 [Clostridium neonatale]CAI3678809.1 hypothetical protein CNEO4_530013 [Clostridium neonatale]